MLGVERPDRDPNDGSALIDPPGVGTLLLTSAVGLRRRKRIGASNPRPLY
jgi:hypothetical protein